MINICNVHRDNDRGRVLLCDLGNLNGIDFYNCDLWTKFLLLFYCMMLWSYVVVELVCTEVCHDV